MTLFPAQGYIWNILKLIIINLKLNLHTLMSVLFFVTVQFMHWLFKLWLASWRTFHGFCFNLYSDVYYVFMVEIGVIYMEMYIMFASSIGLLICIVRNLLKVVCVVIISIFQPPSPIFREKCISSYSRSYDNKLRFEKNPITAIRIKMQAEQSV